MNRLLLAVLMGCVATGQAIECYVCAGDDCVDPFESFDQGTVMSCPPDADSCAKTAVQFNGLSAVYRGCADANFTEGCNRNDILGTKSEVCYCQGHQCNTATVPKVSAVGMITAIAMLLATIY